MLTDETNTNTSTLIESACLPIGCSVSAKYRGAFCSAQVKTIERQVKLKVILIDTNETLIISEEQIVQPIPLRIGNKINIRIPSSNHYDLTSHLSRSILTTIINNNDNSNEKQAIIKQIYDNSIYTVVFNDGDEKSLRRSSLCLQGIRLYQTRIDQQKLLEDISTSSSSLSPITMNNNDITSIVAVRRHNNQNIFPALILKRKTLSDYIWVKSFLNGREYIVHKINDVEPYKNNSQIQSLCRLTSKQATKACDKYVKYNQIPTIWKKKKSNIIHDNQNTTSDSNSSSSESDFDDSDDDTIEKKDSFIAQLFAFMDDRGTPINNIPKIHNYDLDLHRLFKIVSMLGGYNKVTKNDQWNKVYIKMGLPNDSAPKNGRLIENTYKKYLFAYEDLSKKLGTMNITSAYFGGRTSMNNDSRRSLIRVRQQSEEKKKSKQISTPIKQQSRKTQSIDSKQILSSSSSSTTTTINSRRKTIILNKTKSSTILSSSTSESETSDDERTISSLLNTKKFTKQKLINSKQIRSTIQKTSLISNEKKKIIQTKHVSSSSSSSSLSDSPKKHEQLISISNKKPKSIIDSENDMKPVIKIPKISVEILKESTFPMHKFSKKSTFTKVSKVHDNILKKDSHKANSDKQQSKAHAPPLINQSFSESTKQTRLQDLTVLPVTPVSPSPPPPPPPSSIKDESPTLPSLFTTIESINNSNDDTSVPSIFQTLIPSSSITNQQTNEIENFQTNSNKRSYFDEISEFNDKVDEQLSPSKRSRHSMSSQNSDEIINNNNNQSTSNCISINNSDTQLTYEDILVNDILLVKSDFIGNRQYYVRCIEKNTNKKELYVDYNGLDAKFREWIEFDRIIKRENEIEFNEKPIIININSTLLNVKDNEQEKNQNIEENKINSIDQDNGIWKSLEIVSSKENDIISSSSNFQINESNNQELQPICILSSSSSDKPIELQQQPISIDDNKNIISINIDNVFGSNDDNDNQSIYENDHIQEIIPQKQIPIDSTLTINVENILPTSDTVVNSLQVKEEPINTSSSIEQSTSALIESKASSLPCSPMVNITSDNRRISTRQQKRRTFRDPNNTQDSSIYTKKKARFDTDINSNYNIDCINNNDHSPIPMEQQSLEIKRYRTVGKRGGKKTVNQQDNENEDFHLNSPMNATLRQQLEDMFKHRSSRYNFLDLNSNLTGDNRLAHLKDHMRQCQKVFFNLRSALKKIEKQRKIFVRRQKLPNPEIRSYEVTPPTTNEVLLPSTCT
ncbi:unnamed protein product [Rotaria sordida]|uniref:ARID domain-containing protein n=1 Tax=Rotaria sordida TaxID=392033 RepID=A0A814NTE9_9BILA|nr:unnamed protein product [Rotaria sordida]